MNEFAAGDRVHYCVKEPGYDAYRDDRRRLLATVQHVTKRGGYSITLDNNTMCYPTVTIHVSGRYLQRVTA